MKKYWIISAICASTLLMSGTTFAKNDEPMDMSDSKMESKMRPMDPKERKAFMEAAQAKWDKLSDADKKAYKEKVKDKAEKIREKMEERCKDMMANDGEKIYVRMYANEHMKD